MKNSRGNKTDVSRTLAVCESILRFLGYFISEPRIDESHSDNIVPQQYPLVKSIPQKATSARLVLHTTPWGDCI